MGFICMKAMSGGLITNSAAACAWLSQFDNTLPIWGIQKEAELDEFLSYIGHPPVLDDGMRSVIEADRKELTGAFCRGCGYCMPTCPAKIPISMAARITEFIRRSPSDRWLSEWGQNEMKKIEDCVDCGQCRQHCPYGLDTPALLRKQYASYRELVAARVKRDRKKPGP